MNRSECVRLTSVDRTESVPMDVASSEREVSREKDADCTHDEHENHAVAVVQF